MKRLGMICLALVVLAVSFVVVPPRQASAQSALFSCEEWRHYHKKPPLTILPEWAGGWDYWPSDDVVGEWLDDYPGDFPDWLLGSTPSDSFGADCPVVMGGYVGPTAGAGVASGIGGVGSRAGYDTVAKIAGVWMIGSALDSFLGASGDAGVEIAATVTPPGVEPTQIAITPWDSADWIFEPDPSGVGGSLLVEVGDYLPTTGLGWLLRIPSYRACTAVRCNYTGIRTLDGADVTFSGETPPPENTVIEIPLQACGHEPGTSTTSTSGSLISHGTSTNMGMPPWPMCAGAVGFNGFNASSRTTSGSNAVWGYYGPYFGGEFWTQTRTQVVCQKLNISGTGFTSYVRKYVRGGEWQPLSAGVEIPSTDCVEPGEIPTRRVVDLVRYGLDNGAGTRWIDLAPEIDFSDPLLPCLAVGNDCDVVLEKAPGVNETRVRVGTTVVAEPEASEIVARTPRQVPTAQLEAIEENDPELDPLQGTGETPSTTVPGGPTDPPGTKDESVPASTPPGSPTVPPGGGWDSCIDEQGASTADVTWNPVTWVRFVVRWVWVPIYCAIYWLVVPPGGWSAMFDDFLDRVTDNDIIAPIETFWDSFAGLSATGCIPVELGFGPFAAPRTIDVGMCGNLALQGIWYVMFTFAAFGIVHRVRKAVLHYGAWNVHYQDQRALGEW